MGRTADQVRSRIVELVTEPLTPAEFGAVVSAEIHRLVPFSGYCILGLDPSTGMRTFQMSQNAIESCAEELSRNEHHMPDVNQYADLARAEQPAGWLSREHPRASESFRFNEILRPQGIHSEMRLALRHDGRLWGAVVLFRNRSDRPFDDTDAVQASSVAGPLAKAVRRHPVRAQRRRPVPIGQGLVLLAPDNRLVALSDHAQAWLDDLMPGGADETGRDDVTRIVFDAANAARRQPRAAATTIRTVSGRWLRVEGVLIDAGEADVGVLLHAAHVSHLIEATQQYRSLTPRETQVLRHFVDGHPSKQIARELGISMYTVNAHLTSIYRKCGTRGRDELFAQLHS